MQSVKCLGIPGTHRAKLWNLKHEWWNISLRLRGVCWNSPAWPRPSFQHLTFSCMERVMGCIALFQTQGLTGYLMWVALRAWEGLKLMDPMGKWKMSRVGLIQPWRLLMDLGGINIFLWMPGYERKENKSKNLSGYGRFCGLVQNQNREWEWISCPMTWD